MMEAIFLAISLVGLSIIFLLAVIANKLVGIEEAIKRGGEK